MIGVGAALKFAAPYCIAVVEYGTLGGDWFWGSLVRKLADSVRIAFERVKSTGRSVTREGTWRPQVGRAGR